MPSSSPTATALLRRAPGTGTISSARRPDLTAAATRAWDSGVTWTVGDELPVAYCRHDMPRTPARCARRADPAPRTGSHSCGYRTGRAFSTIAQTHTAGLSVCHHLA